MLKTVIILLLSLFAFLELYSQNLFYQNSINGGVKGAGFSQGILAGEISGSFFVDDFPAESQIIDAFLFVGRHGSSENLEVIFNNDLYHFNEHNQVSVSFVSPEYGGLSGVHCVSVKNSVNISSSSYSLLFEQNQLSPSNRFVDFYLLIIYENNNFSPLTISIFTNNSNFQSNVSYSFNELNPVRNEFDVAFAMHNGYICDTNIDGTFVFVNGNNVGLIGGNNIGSSYCGGPSANFEYFDDIVIGLMDSMGNSEMSNNDVLVNVQSYIPNLSTGLIVDLITQLSNNKTNAYWTSIFTYSSPCEPFETSLLTSDTITCVNTPLQLNASGGIAYEWLPQTNLSCYDCPNPVFLGDSTINYTVRIWASDSCSKVLPVRVRVLPQPSFESIDVTESICGSSTGAIAGTSTGLSLPHTYQLNDGAAQNNFSFSNLTAGNYTITVTDANGCSRDSTVQILEINNVQAAFTVNPNSGAAPLQVQTQNNSQNASQYEWFWSDQSSSAFSPSILLDTAGVYTLTLVASNGAAHCNDTTSALIFVEEPFVVFAYTFVTDEAEVYQIFLSGVSEFRYELYALDGKLVYKKSGDISEAGHIDLWSINDIASAMYLYRIWVRDEAGNQEVVDGKVVVVR